MTDNKSKDGADESAELTEEEKAKAAAEEGLSEDELEGVSGGAGVAAPRAAAQVAHKIAVVGTQNPIQGGALGSYHIKTGPVFSKDGKSLPGGNQQGGGQL